jgi:hypothetical protein
MMNGAELNSAEFAYLLATLHAQAVVGLDDPALFPTKSSAREKTYVQGRKDLETNGWLRPIPDHADEYELDLAVLEMVSLVADPDFALFTTFNPQDTESQLVLYYLSEDQIVELSASDADSYHLVTIPDDEALNERIKQMLHLTTRSQDAKFSMDEETLNEIQSLSQKGKMDRAQALLDSIRLKKSAKASFLTAISGEVSGQFVLVRSELGEIQSGRRALLFGEGDAAWIGYKTKPDSAKLRFSTCDGSTIDELITAWLKELTK